MAITTRRYRWLGANLLAIQNNGDPGSSLPALGYTAFVDVTFDDAIADAIVTDTQMQLMGFVFEAAAPVGVPSLITTGVLLATQILMGAGVYAPTVGTKRVRILIVGGGGGGGGALGDIVESSWGGGGSSGVVVDKYIDPAAVVTGGAFIAGAGGVGGAAAPSAGSDGEDTTLIVQGVTYTAKGGKGGAAMAAGVAVLTVLGGGANAGSSAGDITTECAPGSPGFRLAAVIGSSGTGGACQFGAAGRQVIVESAGMPGLGNGGGGGGAGSTSAGGTVGGAGAAGKIIVYEYA
jgi:hypothetical protein